MRCSKCQYYFCWVCGGPGTSCGSFYCKNIGIQTFGKDDIKIQSYNEHLSSQVVSMKNFSRSVSAFDGLVTKYANSEIKRQELQLRSILMWIRGMALVKALSGSAQVDYTDIHNIESSLELTLCKLTGGFNKNRIKAILNFKDYITKPSTKRAKKQKEEVSMHEIFELTKLKDMNESELNGHISLLLKNSMALLLRISTNGKKQGNVSKVTEHDKLCPLNQRGKVPQSPWKGERRFNAPESIERDADSFRCGLHQHKDKSKIPWKGKVRVIARRNFALSLHDV